MYDLIVIGGGFAGLSAAGAYRRIFPDSRILVLEAHSLPGGQASFFRRDGIAFDVGATTLSGLKAGYPLQELHRLLDFSPSLKKVSEGMNIAVDDHLFQWPGEMPDVFFSRLQQERMNELRLLADDLWKYAAASEGLLFPRFGDLRLLPRSFRHLKLLRRADRYLELQEGSTAKKILDELLLISTQSFSHDVPALMAALALSYADDLWRPEGGMGKYLLNLSRHLQSQQVEIRYRSRVHQAHPGRHHVTVQTDQQSFSGREVVVTLPVWNAHQLFASDSEAGEMLRHYSERFVDEAWSAFTFYGKLQSPDKLPVFLQSHIQSPHHLVAAQSLFFTFDQLEGNTYSFTASTHARPGQFFRILESASYEEVKYDLGSWFLEQLKKLNSFHIQGAQLLESGTPRTFQAFTHHLQGRVGGIPHSYYNYRKGLPLLPWERTKPITYLGDSYFPGQGLVAIASRVLKWSRWLLHRSSS